MPEQLIYRQLAMAVRYNTVLFPFDVLPFLKLLEENGFVLEEKIAEVPFGARVEAEGNIAQKGQLNVRIDSKKMSLGVAAPTPTEVVDQLTFLESLIKKEFGFDGAAAALFYEVGAVTIAKSKYDVTEMLRNKFAGVALTEQISNLIGNRVSIFGVRLGAEGVVPNNPNWYDIQIEPPITAPTNEYSIRLVFRNTDREIVSAFARKLDKLIQGIKGLVES